MISRAPDPEPLLTFDWTDSDRPTQAVVSAVADAAKEDPIDLPPLYDAIDPDALDDLLAPRGPGRTPLEGSVAFDYQGYDVVLKGHGIGYVYDESVDVNLALAAGRITDGVDE